MRYYHLVLVHLPFLTYRIVDHKHRNSRFHFGSHVLYYGRGRDYYFDFDCVHAAAVVAVVAAVAAAADAADNSDGDNSDDDSHSAVAAAAAAADMIDAVHGHGAGSDYDADHDYDYDAGSDRRYR
jgi:hypothetical protein